MAKDIKKFEVGKRYKMRSICDSDCVWYYEVLDRTEKTVVLRQLKKDMTPYSEKARFRIHMAITAITGIEAVMPLGTYSMSPILSADNIV